MNSISFDSTRLLSSLCCAQYQHYLMKIDQLDCFRLHSSQCCAQYSMEINELDCLRFHSIVPLVWYCTLWYPMKIDELEWNRRQSCSVSVLPYENRILKNTNRVIEGMRWTAKGVRNMNLNSWTRWVQLSGIEGNQVNWFSLGSNDNEHNVH